MPKTRRLRLSRARRLVASAASSVMILIMALIGATTNTSWAAGAESTWDMGPLDPAKCQPTRLAVVYDNSTGTSSVYYTGGFNGAAIGYYLTGNANGTAVAVERKIKENFLDKNIQIGVFMADKTARPVASGVTWDAAQRAASRADNSSYVKFSPTEVRHNWAQVLSDVKNAGYTDVVFITGFRPTHMYGNETLNANNDYRTTWTTLAEVKAISDTFDSFTFVGVGERYQKNQWMGSNGGITGFRSRRGAEFLTSHAYFQTQAGRDGDAVVNAFDGFVTNQIASKTSNCLIARKSSVDMNGSHYRALAGWKLSAGSTSTTTDANGLSYFTQVPATTRLQETMTAAQQESFAHAGARCQQVAVASDGTQQRTAIPVTTGEQLATLTTDSTGVYECDMQNVPLVPVTLETSLTVDSPQARVILKEEPYEYTASCTWTAAAGGTRVVQAEAVTLKATDNNAGDPYSRKLQVKAADGTLSDLKAPLGARCAFTQVTNRVDEPLRYDTTATSWHANGGSSASANDRSFAVTVDNAARDSGGMTVVATNDYRAFKTSITITADSVGLPVSTTMPSPIGVLATCRYVAHFVPGVPPEQQGVSGVPPLVNMGQYHLTLGGAGSDNVIRDVPVGTNCVYEFADPKPEVRGFSYSAKLMSDTCTRTDTGQAMPDPHGPAIECDLKAASTIIEGPGDYEVNLRAAYLRGTATLTLTKQWTGDDGPRAAALPAAYPFTITCDADGEDVNRSVTLQGGQTAEVTVPAADTCRVAEGDSTTVDSNLQVTKAPMQTVGTPGTGETLAVTMTNDAAWRTRDLSITVRNTFDTTGLTPEQAAAYKTRINAATYRVSGNCRAADTAGSTAIEGPTLITEGGSTTLTDRRYGQSCSFTARQTEAIPGLMWVPGAAQNIMIGDSTPDPIFVEGHYSVATDDVRILHSIEVDEAPADSGSLFAGYPRTEGTLVCGGVSQEFSLTESDTITRRAAAPMAECTLKAQAGTDAPAGFTHRIEYVVNGTRAAAFSGSPADDPGVTFPASSQGTMATVMILHRYIPQHRVLSLTPGVTLVRADTGEAIPAGTATHSAVFADYKTIQTATCTRTGVTVFAQSQQVPLGSTGIFKVPVGATCIVTQQAVGQRYADMIGAGHSLTFADVALDRAATMTDDFRLEYGGFNLKKKVDGDGVATVTNDKKFTFTYVCRLGDHVVKTGELKGGRFDAPLGSVNPANNLATLRTADIPVGAACTLTETVPDVPPATYAERWGITEGPRGWEAENVCDAVGNCATNPDNELEATLTIVKTDRSFVDPDTDQTVTNFQGTLVSWSTYTYKRIAVAVDKKLTGDNAFSVGNTPFTLGLTCHSKEQEAGEIPVQGFDNLAGMQGTAVVTAEDPVMPFTYEDGDSTKEMAVPVGFICTLAEAAGSTFGGTLAVTYEAEGATAIETDASAGKFALPLEPPADGQVTFTVVNAFNRERITWNLFKKLDTSVANDVSGALLDDDGKKTFDVAWICTDPVLKDDAGNPLTYSGTERVLADSTTPVEVVRHDDAIADEPDKRLPAGVSCSMSESPGAKIPEGNTRIQYHAPVVSRASGAQVEVINNDGVFTTTRIEIDGSETTTWTNSYFADDIVISVSKQVDGAPQGLDLSAQQFDFLGACALPEARDRLYLLREVGPEYVYPDPTMPSKPIPDVTDMSFTLADGQVQSLRVPSGTTCTFQESAPQIRALKDLGLTMGASYGRSDNPSVPLAPLEYASNEAANDSFTLPLVENEGTADERIVHGVQVHNTVYRDRAPIVIEQTNADAQVVAGSAFDIYPQADGRMGTVPAASIDNLTTSSKAAYLPPGTYYLVQTRAGGGASLLPGAWRFDVSAAADPQPPADSVLYPDLRVDVAGNSEDSALVTVSAPTDTSPWRIRVANLATGTLPLTGGIGLLWICGAGTILLLGSWTVRWMRIRDDQRRG